MLDISSSISYHYNKFPPNLDYTQLIKPLTRATESLARYDQMLKRMHNNAILLAPLRSQEAVLTSRMEGTISTIDEILEYDATYKDNKENIVRDDTIETLLYSRSMNNTQNAIEGGQKLSSFLLRQAHQTLLSYGRGRNKNPGQFKTEQNYIGDKSNILFTPISPENLHNGLDNLFDYIDNSDEIDLIKTAIAHLEFEALHPFKDGNGRIGRMLITLMLWSSKLISEPYFYVSHYLEENKQLYLETMRNVSKNNDWNAWCIFFFDAIHYQSIRNLEMADKILELYESMKIPFAHALSSKWNIQVLDVIFARPIFNNNHLTEISQVSKQSATRFTKSLLQHELIHIITPPSGSRGALYSFEPLLKLVRI